MPEEIFDSEYGTGFRFSDGNVVYVGYNVWMTDSNGVQITGPSGADYYRSERGYNCQSDKEVAIKFHELELFA